MNDRQKFTPDAVSSGAVNLEEFLKRRQMEEEPGQNQDNFHRLAEIIPTSIYILQDDKLVWVNSTLMEINGFTQEECMEIDCWSYIHPDFRAAVRQRVQACLQGLNAPSRYEFVIKTPKKHKVWVDASYSYLEYQGKPAVIAVLYDITERKQAEEALRQSKQLLDNIISFLPDPTAVVNKKGRIISWNRAIEDMTGVKATDMLGKGNHTYALPFYGLPRPTLLDIVLNQDKELWQQYHKVEYIGEETLATETFCPKIGPQGAMLYAIASPLYDEQGNKIGAIESLRNITRQKQDEERIRYLSYHDKLTGLYNRAFFEEEFKRLDTERQLPLSIIIGDVNGLKLINDAFGHHDGDELLTSVASLLKQACREEDIIARWGGDEFAILLPQTCEEDALKLYKRIKNSCRQAGSYPLQISISLGVATKEYNWQNTLDILKEAEDRMYRNKLLEHKSNRSTFITSLEKTLWMKSHETREHTSRLRRMVIQLGQALALPENELDNLILLASLHDIGKIAIPSSILDKPTRLTPEEWEIIKKHPEIGYRIALSSPDLSPIAESILMHHERWDGSGYLLGEKGPDIPLNARILAIADAYDVMVNGRPYQKSMSHQEALEEIARCAGTQFDPHLAEIFIACQQSDQNPN
ncbi:MAG: diguanylate cyclase [Syntrophomonadaceae bacterium]|nr:diguanylate cyclase [Syntrophomonadaceae bacterium]